MKRVIAVVCVFGSLIAGLKFAQGADPPATAPADPQKPQTPAQRAFERFKSLSGEWQGQSTKGWTDKSVFKVIAAGSCVLGTTFDAHPNETMLTAYHMDGKHLMLTRSEAVIALPGGTGTFEELLETLTLKRLGLWTGPVIIVNRDGYYEPLRQLLESAIRERFMAGAHGEMWVFVDSVEAAVPALEAAPRWSAEARQFAAV